MAEQNNSNNFTRKFNLTYHARVFFLFFFQTLYSANTKHNHYGFFNFKRVEDFQIYSRSDEMFLNVQDL